MGLDRGGRLVAAGVGAAALVGAGLVAALVVGGDDGDKEPEDDETAGVPVDPAEATTSSAPGEEQLCLAYDTMAQGLEAIGTADNPAELETFVNLQVGFYRLAAGTEGVDTEPFAAMASYFEALRDFYAPRSWETVALGDPALAQVPQASTTSAARAGEVVEEHCGVAAPTDDPAPG